MTEVVIEMLTNIWASAGYPLHNQAAILRWTPVAGRGRAMNHPGTVGTEMQQVHPPRVPRSGGLEL